MAAHVLFAPRGAQGRRDACAPSERYVPSLLKRVRAEAQTIFDGVHKAVDHRARVLAALERVEPSVIARRVGRAPEVAGVLRIDEGVVQLLLINLLALDDGAQNVCARPYARVQITDERVARDTRLRVGRGQGGANVTEQRVHVERIARRGIRDAPIAIYEGLARHEVFGEVEPLGEDLFGGRAGHAAQVGREVCVARI